MAQRMRESERRERVERRAGRRCEYCRAPQAVTAVRYHLVMPRSGHDRRNRRLHGRMIHRREIIARFVRPGIREETPVAVLVLRNQDAGRGDAVIADRECQFLARARRVSKSNVQAVVFVLELERLAVRHDTGDCHAFAAGRRARGFRRTETPASSSDGRTGSTRPRAVAGA